MARVTEIVAEQNILVTSIGKISYDYLVIATGSTTNFFGLKNIEQQAMPMKSVTEALNLRSLMLQNFEAALQISEPDEQASYLNFVVVGGGPTGVEMAGSLAELKKHVLPNDYSELDFKKMQIYLIEASDRLLNGMSDVSGQKASEFLQNFDVHVLLNTAVVNYDGVVVETKDGLKIPTRTFIWSAGVMGNVVKGIDVSSVLRGNRIAVDEFCKVKNYQNVFAVGDVACMILPDYPRGHAMVAPVAIQQGHLLAKNLLNLLQNKPLKAFKYLDKGSMATVGRNRAVVEAGAFKTQGLIAWFMWMAVHLMTLVGFRNKVVTFFNWMWSYLNYDRGIRLIIRPYERHLNDEQ